MPPPFPLMVREPTIPLFLWIATAMLVHIGGYKGSDEVIQVVEERRAMLHFTQIVCEEADGPSELEVALLPDEDVVDEDPRQPPPPPKDDEEDPAAPDAVADDSEPPENEPDPVTEPEPEPEPEQEVAKPEEPKEEEKKEEKKKEEEPTAVAKLDLPKLDRRIAVVQHVEDKNQEDNPDAEFIGDEANHVDKQTQAQVTSTDQMDPNPTPGGNHVGPEPEPGNSNETRVAQSEEAPGDPDVQPDPEPPSEAPSPPLPPAPVAVARAAPPPPPREQRLPPQKGQSAKEAVEAQAAVETMSTADGNWDAPRGQEAREAVAAREAKKKRLPPLRTRFNQIFGYGSQATTENGVNLNLSPSAAVSAVGSEQLAEERRRDGERRKSEHRGSWRTLGIERWRAAIENYVASVQPGNQTALNTARVPFASYLNHIHNRIHPSFADKFLSSLDRLPKSSPLNDFSISTHMEIVLNQDDGRLVRMGITKTSGLTAFDIGALEAISAAAPFGRPPKSIVSPDGNVYLHWEFHRDPRYACSTYFARPYIIKAKPRTAPPQVKPPKERPPTDERHGLLLPGKVHPSGINRGFDGDSESALLCLGHQRATL